MPKPNADEKAARAERKYGRPAFMIGIPFTAIALWAVATALFFTDRPTGGVAMSSAGSGLLWFMNRIIGWLDRPIAPQS